jgi:hypothetical protein
LKISFQRCITCPQNSKITVTKQKRKICSHLVTADQGGQKNRNRKTTAVPFLHYFITLNFKEIPLIALGLYFYKGEPVASYK